MKSEFLVDGDKLKRYITKIFTKVGVPEKDAIIAADVLVQADLQGIESHGVARIHRYSPRIQEGFVKVKPDIKILSETPTTILIDGDNGLGAVVSYYAMKKCLEKAKKSGLCLATVRNSNHFGIAGYYAKLALQEDMIGLALTNSIAYVAPTYGRKKMLGTNPIAVAVPTSKETPFLLDMATSVVSWGKIEVYERKEEELPIGWGIDSEGRDTVDPDSIRVGGAQLPLGSRAITSGYKGYGLAVVVDILCGVLSGSAFGSNVATTRDKPSNTGHFFAALDISKFLPLNEFKERMDTLLRELKDSPKAAMQDRIYTAGEIEYENEKERRANGIPMIAKVYDTLAKVAENLEIDMDILKEK